MMNIPTASKWSAEETKLRIELAAAYRLTAKARRMDDLIYCHLSARVPGPELHFLLNPYGLLFSEATASSLIKVDQDGRMVDAKDKWVHNPTGFVLHSAIHRSADDRVCVFHGHPINAMAVSCLEEGLLPLTVWAQQFYKRISYHPYEGPPVRLDERDRLLANLGSTQAMLSWKTTACLRLGERSLKHSCSCTTLRSLASAIRHKAVGGS